MTARIHAVEPWKQYHGSIKTVSWKHASSYYGSIAAELKHASSRTVGSMQAAELKDISSYGSVQAGELWKHASAEPWIVAVQCVCLHYCTSCCNKDTATDDCSLRLTRRANAFTRRFHCCLWAALSQIKPSSFNEASCGQYCLWSKPERSQSSPGEQITHITRSRSTWTEGACNCKPRVSANSV